MTIIDLIKNTKKFDKAKDRFSKMSSVHVNIKKVTPMVGTKTILFSADTWATKNHYKTYLFVKGIDYVDKPDIEHPNSAKLGSDKYYFEQVRVKDHKIQVRCDCRDFHWTFSYYLWKKKSLYQIKKGAEAYRTKGLWERNPKHIPGVCKHVLALIDRLARQGAITKISI